MVTSPRISMMRLFTGCRKSHTIAVSQDYHVMDDAVISCECAYVQPGRLPFVMIQSCVMVNCHIGIPLTPGSACPNRGDDNSDKSWHAGCRRTQKTVLAFLFWQWLFANWAHSIFCRFGSRHCLCLCHYGSLLIHLTLIWLIPSCFLVIVSTWPARQSVASYLSHCFMQCLIAFFTDGIMKFCGKTDHVAAAFFPVSNSELENVAQGLDQPLFTRFAARTIRIWQASQEN